MPRISINDLIKKHKLPSDADFLGYIVHLPDQDEFLADVNDSEDVCSRVFSKIPDLARIYGDYDEAGLDAKECKQRAVVSLLFSFGDQFGVYCSE